MAFGIALRKPHMGMILCSRAWALYFEQGVLVDNGEDEHAYQRLQPSLSCPHPCDA